MLGAGTLDDEGTWHGTLYLRGGGDPTFGSSAFIRSAYGGQGASVSSLAQQLAARGIHRVEGRIVGDESFLDSLARRTHHRLRAGPRSRGPRSPGPTRETLGKATDAGVRSASASCTISVTFWRTKTGARSAILKLTDSAAGSPQQVTLSGTGS